MKRAHAFLKTLLSYILHTIKFMYSKCMIQQVLMILSSVASVVVDQLYNTTVRSLIHVYSSFHSHPWSLETINLFSVFKNLSFWTVNNCGHWIWTLSFLAYLTSALWCLHNIACVTSSFYCWIISIVCICHSVSVPSLVDGHCFRFWVTADNATVGIYMQTYVDMFFPIFPVKVIFKTVLSTCDTFFYILGTH